MKHNKMTARLSAFFRVCHCLIIFYAGVFLAGAIVQHLLTPGYSIYVWGYLWAAWYLGQAGYVAAYIRRHYAFEWVEPQPLDQSEYYRERVSYESREETELVVVSAGKRTFYV